jgi:hypothetical protein
MYHLVAITLGSNNANSKKETAQYFVCYVMFLTPQLYISSQGFRWSHPLQANGKGLYACTKTIRNALCLVPYHLREGSLELDEWTDCAFI